MFKLVYFAQYISNRSPLDQYVTKQAENPQQAFPSFP